MSDSVRRLVEAARKTAPAHTDGVYCSCDKGENCPGMVEHLPRCIELSDAIKEIESTNPSLPHKEVISIQPGDKIVLNLPEKLSPEAYRSIVQSLAETFPNNHCIIIEAGMTMEVYREQESTVKVTEGEQVKDV